MTALIACQNGIINVAPTIPKNIPKKTIKKLDTKIVSGEEEFIRNENIKNTGTRVNNTIGNVIKPAIITMV
ncbi:MAG: hypothetical protein Fur006_34620 [Coleofasciculaceae cyanobacterium]